MDASHINGPLTRFLFVIAILLFIPGVAFSQIPRVEMMVGTPACPNLNAHDRKACRFSRGGHDFQVWPGRVSIGATSDPAVWLVTEGGHPDGMFDHTLTGRKDDHVRFQCFVRSDGKYYGPTGFRIIRGGVWATYGEGIVTASAITTGAVAAYFTSGVGGAAGAAAGGAAAETLGGALSKKFGNKSWEKQAGKVAADICRALAK